MWANVKANISNSSDKSISFEDSMEEVLQEKDELIEKLLELADSLRNNLEKERKEKAELEIKIRQDVCEEYSEYSDQLLEIQKENFVDERETLKEIYKKRIDTMEEMYENIIKEYKLQLDEHSSSEDESFEIVHSQSTMETNKKSEKSIKEPMEKSEINTIDMEDITEESKKMREELQKTVDYTLSLETELETLRKELEGTKLQLESAMKDNDDMKKELDTYKIDCLAYKTDNDVLLMEKSALKEELYSIRFERDTLQQNLIESEGKVASQSQEIQKLLNSIEKLVKVQEESAESYEKSMEEANCKINETKSKLLSYTEELEEKVKEEKVKRTKLESLITTLQEKVKERQNEELNIMLSKNTIEALSKELDIIKMENSGLKEKLEMAEGSVLCLNQSIGELKTEIDNIKDVNMESVRKLNNTINQQKSEAKDAKENLKFVNESLENAIVVTEEQKKELEALKAECTSLKNEMTDILDLKEDLARKWESTSKELECEKSKENSSSAEFIKIIEDLTEKLNNKKTECLNYKNELSSLRDSDTNLALEEKLSFVSKEFETEKMAYKRQLENLNCELKEALCTINKQKKELDDLLNESNTSKNAIAELQKLNKELEEKIHSETESESWACKQELNNVNKKLVEAELTIKKQKDELENLLTDSNFERDAIDKPIKLNEEFEDKISFQVSQTDIILELVRILEDCEFQATHKIKKINSDYVEKLGNLKMQLKTDGEEHKKECDTLYDLIHVLQKCETFSSIKTKELHTSSITQVEQIMDLETSVKAKETYIESLKNDYNNLKKQLKDLQSSFKKQVSKEEKNENESPKKEENSSEKTKKTKNQGEKRKNKQLSERSETSSGEKLQKTKIYEETDENSNNENAQKERKLGKRELRCLENVKVDSGLLQNKDTSSNKSGASKRKGRNESDGNSPEKKTLKKTKMQDIYDVENISKPQNLRIKLLKANIVNDIVAPSPRMTRGRRRLVNLQAKNTAQNIGSPRTVRS